MFSIQNKEWSYRAEGNGNIVLSLHNTGRILRLVKTELTKSLIAPNPRQQQEEENEKEKRKVSFDRLVSFGRDVVAPMLGTHFVHPGEVVRISGVELQWLNTELFPLRPEFRRLEKTLAEEDSSALLFLDHCTLSPSAVCSLVDKGLKWRGDRPVVVAIEIKPKMGFISTRSTDIVNVCKYHLMQLWKLKHKRIKRISDYCPLDLFSGCRARMTDSIRQLLRNPQNNLRIFLDGSLVYGENLEDTFNTVLQQLFTDFEDSSCVEDHFCNLLVGALLFDHSCDDVEVELYERRIPSQDLCGCKSGTKTSGELLPPGGCNTLPKGCILNRLISAQMLYQSDARSLLPVYEKILPHLDTLSIEKVNKLLYGPTNSLDMFLKDSKGFEADCVQVRNYLLSCTAKDCSLMLTFCPLSDVSLDADSLERDTGAFIFTDTMNAPRTPYLCMSAFVDLDRKPLSRVTKHASEEDEMEINFLTSL